MPDLSVSHSCTHGLRAATCAGTAPRRGCAGGCTPSYGFARFRAFVAPTHRVTVLITTVLSAMGDTLLGHIAGFWPTSEIAGARGCCHV